MRLTEIERKLKQILSEAYGGPSISYQNGLFIIYDWTDAPVRCSILAQGATLPELIKDYDKQNKREHKK